MQTTSFYKPATDEPTQELDLSYFYTNSPVIVIIPSGNYNEPRELGRYKNLSIAMKIVSSLGVPEYRVFSVDSGEELQIH
jgi:hypothetical protein